MTREEELFQFAEEVRAMQAIQKKLGPLPCVICDGPGYDVAMDITFDESVPFGLEVKVKSISSEWRCVAHMSDVWKLKLDGPKEDVEA